MSGTPIRPSTRRTCLRVARAVLLWAAAVAAGGCPRPTGPQRVVVDWLAAVERQDPAAARALLADEARASATADALAARARTVDPAAVRRAREAAAAADVAAVEARWRFQADELVVARSGGAWVLRGGVLGLYPCDTPAASLRSFVQAWRRGRWDVVHRLAPAAVRTRYGPDEVAARLEAAGVRDIIDERADALGEALAPAAVTPAPVRTEGDSVAVPYGRFRATLALEDGCWRVLDL